MDSEIASPGLSGIAGALSKAMMIDWIQFKSSLWALRPKGLSTVGSCLSGRTSLSVVSKYALIDGNPIAGKYDTFYWKLFDLLRTTQ